MRVVGWLRARDAGFSALRRAGRAAIVMPVLFAVADKVMGNPTLAVFAAFGAVASLLFVDFGGPVSERVAAQASLGLAGAVLVCVGTLSAHAVWLAAVATLAIGLAVLFAGVVSSVLAGATTTLLVAFVLSVTLGGPASTIPDRVAGWLLASAVSVLAIAGLWPAPTREPLRRSTAAACGLLGRRLRAEVAWVRDGFRGDRAELDAVVADAQAAVAGLRAAFFATPYRPTGLSTGARVSVRLVDQVIWLDSVLERMSVCRRPGHVDETVCALELAVAGLLDRCGEVLESGRGDPLGPAARRLRDAQEALERTVTAVTPAAPDDAALVSALEPSFRAREMSFAAAAIAANAELIVAAGQRSWWQQLLGRQPSGVASRTSSAQERAGAHVERHSVWLHNSVRGAVGLSLAVVVAASTGVQHSFWVVLGTLAVLRSTALNTGQNALRGLLGTLAGFVVGGALVFAIGTNTTVFWVLLPVAILVTGVAPAAISFAAGQAAFTTTMLILYNIIEPAGWRIGLVRIEDVAIGCGVSLAVGVLLWPRGAAGALGQALAEGFSDGAAYLRSAIGYAVTRCDAALPPSAPPADERRRAAAAARRLDDAFRGYLAERGTKRLALADVTALVSAVAVLRLTAEAILELWEHGDQAASGDRAAARAEVVAAGARLAGWYETAARAIAGFGDVPAQLVPDAAADRRLIAAVRRDLGGADGTGTATAVKMIWTADHIDAARRLQGGIAAPARAAAAAQGTPGSWLGLRPRRPSHVGFGVANRSAGV